METARARRRASQSYTRHSRRRGRRPGRSRAHRRRGRDRQDSARPTVLRGEPRRTHVSSSGRATRSSRRGRSARSSTSRRRPAVSSLTFVETGAIPYRVAAELSGGARRRRTPTIVVLEDVHWADEATLDVLRLVARRIEDVPRAADRHLPRRRARRNASASRRARQPRDSTLESGESRFRRSHSPRVARLAEPYGADPEYLFRMTAGNPFFVTEVLAGETQRDSGDRS